MDPGRFREDLKRFDPALDFVWNVRRQVWEVIGTDARRRRYLIFSVTPFNLDRLGPKLIEGLWEMAPHKQGGAAAMNRRLDAQADDKEQAQDRRIGEALDEVAEGAYESLRRRDGMRVNNAGIPEIHEGFVVNDRRCTQEDADGAPGVSAVRPVVEREV